MATILEMGFPGIGSPQNLIGKTMWHPILGKVFVSGYSELSFSHNNKKCKIFKPTVELVDKPRDPFGEEYQKTWDVSCSELFHSLKQAQQPK